MNNPIVTPNTVYLGRLDLNDYELFFRSAQVEELYLGRILIYESIPYAIILRDSNDIYLLSKDDFLLQPKMEVEE